MVQFKTKTKIFIQKDIHSIECGKFNIIIHSIELEENHLKLKKKGQKIGLEPSLNDLRWVWDILQGPFLQTKTRIYIQKDYSFFRVQNIHSRRILTFFKISRIFIQNIVFFFKSWIFKTNIHLLKYLEYSFKKSFFFKSRISIQKNIHFFQKKAVPSTPTKAPGGQGGGAQSRGSLYI